MDLSDDKTDEELVAECNALARLFYRMHGYEVAVGYRFDQARHPQEVLMWALASAAYSHIGGTDIDSALDNLSDD